MDRGELVPHFTVTTVDGDVVSYETSWQRHHLVLIFTAGQAAVAYVDDVSHAVQDFAALSAVFVVTAQPIGDLREPTLVVADRWGEIVLIERATTADALPGGTEVRRWLEHLEIRCPECEGEAR